LLLKEQLLEHEARNFKAFLESIQNEITIIKGQGRVALKKKKANKAKRPNKAAMQQLGRRV
jgi:hypothetical protein